MYYIVHENQQKTTMVKELFSSVNTQQTRPRFVTTNQLQHFYELSRFAIVQRDTQQPIRIVNFVKD